MIILAYLFALLTVAAIVLALISLWCVVTSKDPLHTGALVWLMISMALAWFWGFAGLLVLSLV